MIILVFCITTVVYFVIMLSIHYSWNGTLIIYIYYMIILSKNELWNCAVCASIEIVVTTLSSLRTEPSLGFVQWFILSKVSLPIFGPAGVFVGSSAARFVKTLGHVGHYRHIHRDCCFRQRDRRVELPKFSPIRSPEEFLLNIFVKCLLLLLHIQNTC